MRGRGQTKEDIYDEPLNTIKNGAAPNCNYLAASILFLDSFDNLLRFLGVHIQADNNEFKRNHFKPPQCFIFIWTKCH